MQRKHIVIPALLAVVLLGGGIGWTMMVGKNTDVAENFQPTMTAMLPIEADDAASDAAAQAQVACAQPPCGPKEKKVAEATELSEDSSSFAMGVGGLSEEGGDSDKSGWGSSSGSSAGGSAAGSGAYGGSNMAGGAGGFSGNGGNGIGGGFLGGSVGGAPGRQTLAKADTSKGGLSTSGGGTGAAPVVVNPSNAVVASNASASSDAALTVRKAPGSSVPAASAGNPSPGRSGVALDRAAPSSVALPGNSAGQGIGNGPPAVVLAGTAIRPDASLSGSDAKGTPLDPQVALAPAGNAQQPANQGAGAPTALAAEAGPNALPEPDSMALLGIALCGVFFFDRRRRATACKNAA